MRRARIGLLFIVTGLLAACTAPSGGGATSPGAPAPTTSAPVVAPAY